MYLGMGPGGTAPVAPSLFPVTLPRPPDNPSRLYGHFMHATIPWPLVGALDPAGLVDARLQAHHAAQLVVALGISFLPPRPDDSHTNLEWLPGRALGGRTIPAATPFRGALRLDPLILMILDESGDVMDEYRLPGRTLAQAFRWLKDAVRAAGGPADLLTDRKHYTIPLHPVGEGASFTPDETATRELSAYYDGASLALSQVAARRSNASEVRCWPHHFDIATLMTVSPGRTVGAGLSPGDGYYAEPYYYVTPYPYPKGPLPPLQSGQWHTHEWTGSVLPASRLVRERSEPLQHDMIQDYLAESIAACEALL